MFSKNGLTESEKEEIIRKALEIDKNRDNFTLSEPITQEDIDNRKKILQKERAEQEKTNNLIPRNFV